MIFVLDSSTGHLINQIKTHRAKFSDGPYVKVHSEVTCLTKAQGDKLVVDGILHIPKQIQSRDITDSGHLRVKMVEISSYCPKTTEKMEKFFFNATKVTIYKETLDVEAIVGSRNAAKGIAMVIGKKCCNLHAVVQREAKVFTDRATAPYVFNIHAYSVKNKLAVKIRLEKAIRKINQDLIQKEIGQRYAAPATSEQKSANRYADLDADEDDSEVLGLEDSRPDLVRHPAAETGVGYFPPLTNASRPKTAIVDPQDTLAAKLQDAAARGEVFAEYIAKSDDNSSRSSTPSTDDDMPALIPGMTGDQIFASVAANSADMATWS